MKEGYVLSEDPSNSMLMNNRLLSCVKKKNAQSEIKNATHREKVLD
jgi:hypothetical protein